MRAIRVHEFGPPDVMKVEHIQAPAPGPGEVLVRLHAAGVNPVDTYIRGGNYAQSFTGSFTPGIDGAGEVVSWGDGVQGFEEGQRVFLAGRPTTGTYAELCLASADALLPLPEALTMEEGAALFVAYATAYRALIQLGGARPGQRVLIHGASGGVGTAALQWASTLGLFVVGTASTPEGMAQIMAQGADAALNHGEPGYQGEAMALTEHEGYDLILEMAAHINLDADLDLVARRGRIMVIGNRGTLTLNPRKAMAKESSVQGVMLFAMTPGERAEFAAALAAAARLGALKPVIGERFSLERAADAHERIMGESAAGQLILTMT